MCSKQKRKFKYTCFNMIAGKIESNILSKEILFQCKYKFDGRKCNSNQKWKNDTCWCEFRNMKKTIFGILLHVVTSRPTKKQKQFQQILMKKYNS